MSLTPIVTPRRGQLAAIRRRAMRTARARYPKDRREGPVRLRLWLPLTPLFVLLAPFALLLSLFGYFVPQRRGIDPVLAAVALGGVLLSLSGTDVEVRARDADIRIRLL